MLLRGFRPVAGCAAACGRRGDGLLDLRLEGGRIVALGTMEPQAGERVVELAGAWLAPGIIDAHVHLGIGEAGGHGAAAGPQGDGAAGDWGVSAHRLLGNARATFADGVTAVRNLGNVFDPKALTALRDMANDPLCPRVVSAGRALSREGRYGAFLGLPVPREVDVAELAAREIEAGAAVIKIILNGGVDFATGAADDPHFNLDELRRVVGVARGHGVSVAVHANGDAAIAVALRAGVDTLEHGILIGDDNLRLLAESGTRWIPTLTPLARLRGAPGTERLPDILAGHLRAVGRGAELGAGIVLGTDSGCRGVPHSSAADEIRLLGEAGLSPSEIGVAATREAAAALGLGGGYGRLEVGAYTDLVWFAQDPFGGGCALEVLGVVRGPPPSTAVVA